MSSAAPAPLRSTTSYAVLGLLAVRSWTTYELAKQAQRSLAWFWPRAERKLYDEPKHLAAAGLATAVREYTGQRPRTVYAITDAGREALRRWLDAPPASPSVESEATVKVFFSDSGSLDQLQATLAAVEADTADRLRTLAGFARASVESGPAFPERQHISALTLRLQQLQEQAVLSWAQWAQEQVGQWTSTTDPGSWDAAGVLDDLADDAERVLRRRR